MKNKTNKIHWRYSGDVDLHYGGLFVSFREWHNGYAEVVRVDDLGNAGFDGANSIERLTVNGVDDPKRYAKAMSIFSYAADEKTGKIYLGEGKPLLPGTLAHRMCVVSALVAYGCYDPEESEVVIDDPDAKLSHEGWTAKRIRSGTLRSYVRKNFLGYAR